MFNELGGGSGKGLDREKISSVAVDTLKKVKAGLEALFTLVRWGRLVYLLAILGAAILLSGALVSTVKKGTYQIRQNDHHRYDEGQVGPGNVAKAPQ